MTKQLIPAKVERCHIQDCPAVAMAFLQTLVQKPDGNAIKKVVGYCQVHAMEKHNQLMAELDARYNVASFEKPNKL